MSRPSDAGGEYSLGPGPRPSEDPDGVDLPRTTREEAQELRRRGLRERDGLPTDDDK
jgi:hypothetical protein